jgi:hypothetical protein
MCQSRNEQLQRTAIRRRGARDFIIHLRRAGKVNARPLNCGVRHIAQRYKQDEIEAGQR